MRRSRRRRATIPRWRPEHDNASAGSGISCGDLVLPRMFMQRRRGRPQWLRRLPQRKPACGPSQLHRCAAQKNGAGPRSRRQATGAFSFQDGCRATVRRVKSSPPFPRHRPHSVKSPIRRLMARLTPPLTAPRRSAPARAPSLHRRVRSSPGSTAPKPWDATARATNP